MRELFILITHLLTTAAKLAKPGGLGAVAAESVALKHQLLIMNRKRQRAPVRECPILGVAQGKISGPLYRTTHSQKLLK